MMATPTLSPQLGSKEFSTLKQVFSMKMVKLQQMCELAEMQDLILQQFNLFKGHHEGCGAH